MKTTIKVFLYLLFSVTFVAVTGCGKDDPLEDPTAPIKPENPGDEEEKPGDNQDPGSEQPIKPDLSKEILGEWTQTETDLGTMANVSSTSQMKFGTSDEFSVDWSETEKTDKPYTTATGKYSINGDSLRVEWKTVITDSVTNVAFTTFYLSGECNVTDNILNYTYSVYDTDGSKLSGPHTTKLAKQ